MADRKLLNLEVNAGLCNRLRALVAGICWAEKLDRKLVVHWPTTKPECAAGFYDLFGLSSLPDFVKVIYIHLPSAETCLQSADAERIFGDNTQNEYNIKSHGNFWGGDRGLYLTHLRRLTPSTQVQAILHSWKANGLDSTDIVYHIRGTDNEKAIRLSPFALFVSRIMIEGGPVVVFSDEREVVQNLQNGFGAKVLAFESVRSRTTLEGMLEAAAVFFAMAGKKQIKGSANSSFSEIASEYGGASLEVLRQG
jgi:hypothetical protein